MDTLGEALGPRLVAFGIDAAIVGTLWAIVWFAGGAVRASAGGGMALLDGGVSAVGAAVWLLTWLAVVVLVATYFAAGHAVAGQSLGKRMTDVVVVGTDGEPCDWRAAGVRTAVLLAPAPVVAALDLLLGFQGAVLGAVLVLAWLLVELVALVVDDDHRRVGDRLADTVVVAESLASV